MDELYNFLNEREGGTFDRSFVEEVFQLMDKDGSHTVNRDEFIRNFAIAEKMIEVRLKNTAKKIMQLEKRINEIDDDRKADLVEKLRQARGEINYWRRRITPVKNVG